MDKLQLQFNVLVMRFLSNMIFVQDLTFASCKDFCILFYVFFVIVVWTFCHIVYQLQKEGLGRP